MIPAPGATTVTALTGKDFRSAFTRSYYSNLEQHSNGPNPRRNTAPQLFKAHPSPTMPSWVGRPSQCPCSQTQTCQGCRLSPHWFSGKASQLPIHWAPK